MVALSGPLAVDAELRFDFDGHRASVSAHGTDVFLTCADPQAVLDQLTSAALPAGVGLRDGARAVGVAADGLHRAGLRLVVTGPRGDVLALGRAQESSVGRVITGSRHVQLGSRHALTPLVSARISSAVSRRRLTTTVAVLGALAVGYRWRSAAR